jgi:hypothetical protein
MEAESQSSKIDLSPKMGGFVTQIGIFMVHFGIPVANY